MDRIARIWSKINDWPYAHPGRWGAVVGTMWAVIWLLADPASKAAIASRLVVACVGGIVFGIFVYLVTRWRRNARVAHSTTP